MRILSSLLAVCVVSAPVAAGSLTRNLRLDPIASGFSSPLAVVVSGVADDRRLFVVEQGGRVCIVDTANACPTSAFLRLAGSGSTPPPLGFSSGGERGLLGLAFAPDYASSGFVYVSYTDAAGDTVLARYSRDAGNPDRLDPASAAVVLRVDQDNANHNGGNILFGPDGMLYLGLGDGGSSNDPCDRAQTLLTADLVGAPSGGSGGDCAADTAFLNSGGQAQSRALMGKMLRIDLSHDGGESGRCGLATASVGVSSVGYAIPADNPYAGADGICDEVFLSGLRNPWRFSFDRATGDLWIGDVGQSAREEVDLITAGQSGLDLGWRCREGFLTTGNACSDTLADFTAPQLDYGRDIGQSITGGYRYRGPVASLQGLYFFADFVQGRHFHVDPDNLAGGFTEWAQKGLPASFGEDRDGRLYEVNYNGCLYRLDSERPLLDGFEDPGSC